MTVTMEVRSNQSRSRSLAILEGTALGKLGNDTPPRRMKDGDSAIPQFIVQHFSSYRIRPISLAEICE